MEDYLITVGVGVLLTAIKNPKNKEKLRKICLKVFNSIRAAYPGDPDFE